jgi:hypothetical protein
MGRIPSNILEFAKRKGCVPDVKKIAKWIQKASNGERQGICGGTAIGKGYDTLVLDIVYQGSEIYLDIYNGTITFLDEPVSNYKDFKMIWDQNMKK